MTGKIDRTTSRFENLNEKCSLDTTREHLKRYFGYKNFRNIAQKRAIQTIFEGNSDVYFTMQPGAGKSLCFQLPTVLKHGRLTVVFVPTRILAKNQISFLRRKHIGAEYLCAQTPKKRLWAMMQEIQKLAYQFLYVLVDKRSVDLVKDFLIELRKKNALSYIVFDEAHSASSLSHDYIPAYQDMAKLVKKTCPTICKIALTSMDMPEVRRDLIKELDMKNVLKVRSKEHTISVFHDVHFIDTIAKPLEHLKEFIAEALRRSRSELSVVHQKCGIIFCRKKQVAKTIAEQLITMNILAVSYHGDLRLYERDSICERWNDGKIPVIVTTHKFGIGVHKPNVRFVVHWNLPLSIQQLYQENGRISQDGKKAFCRVYYSFHEEEKIKTYIKSLSRKSSKNVDEMAQKLEFFNQVIDYCLQTNCRYVALRKYFKLKVPNCGNCDACRDVRNLRSRVNEFLKHRTSMKEAIANIIAGKKVKITDQSVKIALDDMEKKDKIGKNFRPTTQGRKLSLNRLFHELMKNYMKIGEEIKESVNKCDITEIACRLEYALYTDASLRKKYNRDVIQTIFSIRSYTECGLACGHLKHFEAHKKSNNDYKPIVVLDDSVMEVDRVITATDLPELIDLASESSSESETP